MSQKHAKSASSASGTGAIGGGTKNYEIDDRTTWIVILSIVLLGAALRLVALGSVPPSICQDEAVNAYDAHCLLLTGKDHVGARWPIFFRSFGDYHPGPPVYLQIPFQMLLGMNAWSARLPDALFGTANVWFLFLLVRRFYGDRAGLWAAGLLAVSPWHIHISRLAFGIGISISLITLGLLIIFGQLHDEGKSSAVKRAALLRLVLAGVSLGIASWTYHAMRVVVPMLLLGIAVIDWRALKQYVRRPRGWTAVAALALGLAAGIGPFVWAWIKTPEQAWARATEQSILQAGWPDAFTSIVHNYAMHFTPSFLFLEGDLSLIQSISGYGQLHLVFAILLVFGLCRVVLRWRSEPWGRFALWWLLIGPIPSALSQLDGPSGHCLRSAGVIPAYDIIAAIGLVMVIEVGLKRSLKFGRGIVAGATAMVAISAAYFAFLFFARYPTEASDPFWVDWRPVCLEIKRLEADYDAVMITHHDSGHIGIMYLFWSENDPRIESKSPRVVLIRNDDEYLARWGKFFFVSSETMDQVLTALPPGARLLVAERPGLPVPGTVLKRYYDYLNWPSVVLYDVQTAATSQPTTQVHN